MPPAPTPAVPIPRELQGGIPSFPFPGPGDLEPGALSWLALLSRTVTGKEDSRRPPSSREEVGKGREDLVPRSRAQPAWIFSLGSGFRRHRLALPHPHPSLREGGARLCPQENSSTRQASLAPGQGPELRHLETRNSASKSLDPGALSPLPPGYPHSLGSVDHEDPPGKGEVSSKLRQYMYKEMQRRKVCQRRFEDRQAVGRGRQIERWGSSGRADLHAQTIRSPPPQKPSINTLGARTWEEGGVLRAIKEGSLRARPPETRG